MDVFAVNRRDEGLVQRFAHFMRDAVSSALGVVHITVVFVAQVRVVVVRHQLRERTGRFNNAICMLIEHFEKIAFARQELAKQHGRPFRGYCLRKLNSPHANSV